MSNSIFNTPLSVNVKYDLVKLFCSLSSAVGYTYLVVSQIRTGISCPSLCKSHKGNVGVFFVSVASSVNVKHDQNTFRLIFLFIFLLCLTTDLDIQPKQTHLV